jgi:hypothetical protein
VKVVVSSTFAEPRERVFAALIDPDVLQRCIPGCDSLARTGDDTFDATLNVGLAGVTGRYRGRARLSDIVAPESYTLTVEGSGSPGYARGAARLSLADEGDRTTVTCEADVQVGGLVAAIGSRLIEAASRKLAGEFFASLERVLAERRASGRP